MNELLNELLHTSLEYREGTSDKVYRAAIEKSGDGFVVNFAYGRRGATLNTGAKTSAPVEYDEAVEIYTKLVQSKTAKGYKVVGAQAGTGIGASVTTRVDTGLRAQLLNPITEDEAEKYLDHPGFCMQEKYDGKRVMLRKHKGAITACNRDGLATGIPDALIAQLSRMAGDYVIDGECVDERFYAFDLLENVSGDLRMQPYRTRLEALQKQFGNLGGNVFVAKTAFCDSSRKLLAELKAARREGVVFKELRAPWAAGRPASGGCALKCKFWASCSCVVLKINGRRSIQVALGGTPVGNVTIPPNHAIPAVGCVVEVRYLYVASAGGSLYQPVYLGVRDDVRVEDCTAEKQNLKFKPLEDAA